MDKRPSLLEMAEDALREATARYQQNPTDAGEAQLQHLRTMVREAKELEQRAGGPIRPPSN